MTTENATTNDIPVDAVESNPAEFVVPQIEEDRKAAEAATKEAPPKAEAAKTDEPVTEKPKEESEDPAVRAAAREAFYARRAQRAAEKAMERAEALEREVAALKSAPRQNAAADDGAPQPPKRPNPDDYELKRWDPKYEEANAKYLEEFDQYVAAKAEYTAQQATARLTQEARQTTEMASLAATADAVGKRGVDKYSDFEEVVQDALKAMPPSPQALQRLVKLENAEDVFYHLGQHPELLEKITAMEPMDQTLEFGKISARLANAAKVAAKVTKATPTPNAPARGTNGQFATEADARYEKMLKAQQNYW